MANVSAFISDLLGHSKRSKRSTRKLVNGKSFNFISRLLSENEFQRTHTHPHTYATICIRQILSRQQFECRRRCWKWKENQQTRNCLQNHYYLFRSVLHFPWGGASGAGERLPFRMLQKLFLPLLFHSAKCSTFLLFICTLDGPPYLSFPLAAPPPTPSPTSPARTKTATSQRSNYSNIC